MKALRTVGAAALLAMATASPIFGSTPMLTRRERKPTFISAGPDREIKHKGGKTVRVYRVIERRIAEGSKYSPHQGNRERARRMRQMAKAMEKAA